MFYPCSKKLVMKPIWLFVLWIRLEALLLLSAYKGSWWGWAVEHTNSSTLFQADSCYLRNIFKMATFHAFLKNILNENRYSGILCIKSHCQLCWYYLWLFLVLTHRQSFHNHLMIGVKEDFLFFSFPVSLLTL